MTVYQPPNNAHFVVGIGLFVKAPWAVAAAVVNEPWGDNSRYWVGLEDPDANPDVDISPIDDAFRRYSGILVVTLWPAEHGK